VKCLLLNARSLLNKFDTFEAIVNVLDVDIIGVTESWATPQILDTEISLCGYQLFRSDRNSPNKGGGVLLYVRESLKPAEFFVKAEFNDNVWCQVGELIIGVCYRSTNYAIVGEENNSMLYDLLKEVNNKHILLMGDFNFPEVDWSSTSVDTSAHPDCKKFLEVVEDCFLTQHVLQPTRGNAILDLVFTREPELVSEITVGDQLGNSDHNMISFRVQQNILDTKSTSQIRDYHRGDYDSIRSKLAEVDWDKFFTGTVDECWLRFKTLLLSLEEQFVPLRNTQSKRKPIWMSYKALKSVKKKLKVFSKYKDKSHPAVQRANKKAKSHLTKARRSFENKLAANIKSDTKSFYAYARSKSKSKVQVTTLLNEHGMKLSDDVDIAQSFNTYFASVFTQEDINSIPKPVDVFVNSDDKKLIDISFTQHDIDVQLAKLRIDKAAGADGLSPRLLSETKQEISYPLLILFRKSLDEASVPDDWKCANVCPIFKKGNRNLPENFRPVSLTSQICKIFEAVIRDTVVQHLESNCLINGSQHGFRKGYSCLTNILTFLDKVTGLVDTGSPVDAVFLDFAKAFDKVPHRRLVSKLLSHGIGGKVCAWITEWLKGRRQRVCLRGSLSDWLAVLSGVPQGSVLGPILFLIFINDLDYGIKNYILKFADDTKIFGSILNRSDFCQLQDDINSLVKWSEDWQMLFNIGKCKVMHFGRTNQSYEYQMSNSKVEVVTEQKDLGVWISHDLKVSQHCLQAYSKANKLLGVLNRTVKCKDTANLLCFYKSLIRPHLEFCTSAWSPYYAKDKVLIEKIQRRFTRMIPHLRHLPYEERLVKLRLWSLEDRRIRSDLLEIYKMIHGLSAVKLETFFEVDYGHRTRGHDWKLKKMRSSTNLRLHFFSERVINWWNSLENPVVCAPSVNSFKSHLQRMWCKGEFLFG